MSICLAAHKKNKPSLKGKAQQLSTKSWMWLFYYAAYMNQTILNWMKFECKWGVSGTAEAGFYVCKSAGAVFPFSAVSQSVSLSSVLNRKSTEDAVWVETSARDLFKSWNTWTDALWVKSGDLNHRRCNRSLKAGSQTSLIRRRVSFHPLPRVSHMSKKWRKKGRGSQSKVLGWGFRHVSSGVQTGVFVQIQTWISNPEQTLNISVLTQIWAQMQNLLL